MDEFFEGAGGGLDSLCADVAGDAFQGVSKAFGEGYVALGEGGGDLSDGWGLLFGKLAQEFQIEFLISGNAGKAVFGVEGVGGWEGRGIFDWQSWSDGVVDDG